MGDSHARGIRFESRPITGHLQDIAMTALSTSFFTIHGEPDVDRLVAVLRDLSIVAIELDYRIPAPAYHRLRPLLPKAGIRVASVHNFFPLPIDVLQSGGSGDLFSLADTRREERQEAVKRTLATIDHACDLEARAVVLHCGQVDMIAEVRQIYDRFGGTSSPAPEHRQWLDGKLAERDRRKPAHLDALRFSLDTLLASAERRQIRLGLETRYHYHELPGPADFTPLLAEFAGAPLGYWHDTGHAQANVHLGLIDDGQLLEELAEHLIGVHFHDAEGLDDHLPPGKGHIDFKALASNLSPEVLRVLELRPGTACEAVREGLAHLAACEAG